MIKRIGFVRRNPDLDVEEFHAHWRGAHADLVAASPAGAEHLLRYEQHRRTARDYERADCPWDGVAVQWYDSLDGFRAMREDPRHAAVREDAAQLFGDVLEVLTGEEMEVIAGPPDRGEPVTKLICGVRHKPGMSLDDFHRYWWEVHGPLNRDTPAVRQYLIRYEQNHRLPEDYARTECDLDGVTIEWFRSARDFFGMAVDPESRDVIRTDEENFLDPAGLVWLLTGPEQVVLDRRESYAPPAAPPT
ncbi:MAG: EthD domain-containing protein [Acidimicrobiia bacterium]